MILEFNLLDQLKALRSVFLIENKTQLMNQRVTKFPMKETNPNEKFSREIESYFLQYKIIIFGFQTNYCHFLIYKIDRIL